MGKVKFTLQLVTTMSKLFVLGLVAISAVKADITDVCASYLFDDCRYPALITGVHVGDIMECKDLCDLYAIASSCDFFTYSTLPLTDENCKIYLEDWDTFVGGCNLLGAPVQVDGNCIVQDDHCDINDLPGCDTCTACGTSKCYGIFESECADFPKPDETDDAPSQGFCEA